VLAKLHTPTATANMQRIFLSRRFRVLKDGSIVTRVRRRQWAFLPRGDYCLDGIRNPFQGGSDVVETEPETVIFYCHKDTETGEVEKLKRLLTSTTKNMSP